MITKRAFAPKIKSKILNKWNKLSESDVESISGLGAVGFDGALAAPESGGDLLVWLAFHHPVENLAFRAGETGGSGGQVALLGGRLGGRPPRGRTHRGPLSAGFRAPPAW